jgi:hypothetical protein
MIGTLDEVWNWWNDDAAAPGVVVLVSALAALGLLRWVKWLLSRPPEPAAGG